MNKFDPAANGRAMTTCMVLGEVWSERQRQDDKWGQQNHNAFVWTTILTEEVGEVAKEALDDNNQKKKMRAELLQVAAVAVAAVECIDRMGELS
jgi:NTP pyrophosphatase (non-canonical NTP hydrolase)